jgi:hypothetical protein
VGVIRVADDAPPSTEGLAMSETDPAHRALAIGYFNAAWELVDLPDRSPEQDREMVTTAFASRRHWIDADGTDENIVIADWQVAHTASLAGFADVATAFAAAAYDRARAAGLAVWLRASTAEGRARAAAAAGDRSAYERFAGETRELLAQVDDDEDRQLIDSQLASIPVP